MFDKNYYTDKLVKLQQKGQANLNKLITCAFEVVAEQGDINERIKEIQDLLKAEPTQETKGVKDTPKK
jgi:hypothetical protein